MKLLVVHGGGPTAVLNASLAGVLDACRESPRVEAVFGARFGVEGLLALDFIDLTGVDAPTTAALKLEPGSAIGSSRKKFLAEDAERLLSELQSRRVNGLLLTGGNGSMRTAKLLAEMAAASYPDLRVVGIPKTVDNDLLGTDHTPGYGSAAKFYAQAVRDIGQDNRGLPSPVTVVEIIGRNAGWVTAATALARGTEGDAPHLIYLPERPPTLERICRDVEAAVQRYGRAVLAVCEGLRDPQGDPFGAAVDRPGSKQHELAANLAFTLAQGITAGTGLRARAEKPGLLGRSCSFAVSETDREESYTCGRSAVAAALEGVTGVMMALERLSNAPYRSEVVATPLDEAVGEERLLPADWIATGGSDVTAEFLDYVRPLTEAIKAPLNPFLK